MKKLIIKSFLTVSLGLTLFVVGMGFYSQKLSANTATISYITTCVGENETSMGINYHCSIADSFVQYSTTSTFTNDTTQTITAASTLWSAEANPNDSKTGFNERYVSKVNLTGLTENTQYYYRICAGSSISKTYKFKTAAASATNINFLFGTDIHAAGGSYTPTRPNSMIENVKSNVRNLNLLVLTGDQVDRGGYESHWQSYYTGMQVYDEIAVAAIPGNHEYYHSSDSAYVSPLYFNQFHNNPQNGPESRKNSSYYFNYGNILFIMIDVIDKKNATEHKEWIKTTIENNPSQWIIVGTHANAITGGSYSTDSKWMMNTFGDLFEEYQVDLVIGGHEHVYLRKDSLYNNEKNTDLGVTYYVSPAAQHKQYGIKEDYKDTVDEYENTNYKINTISVTNSNLVLSLYDETGEKATNSRTGNVLTFELLPKRSGTITSQKDSTLEKGVKLNHDKENEDAEITWNKVCYGNVKTVKVERTSNGNTSEFSTFVASEKLTSLNIGPIYNDRNYSVKVTLIKYDGTTIEKEFEIINLVPYNLNLELNGGILTSPEEWVTYLSGKVTKLPTPIKDGHVFQGWFENELFEGEAVTKITSDVTGDKSYYAKWAQQFTITYNTYDGQLNDSAQTSYLEGDSFSLQTPYRDNDMFLGWYTNPEFTGEPIENITETTKGDLVLYAKWAKKCSITYNENGGELNSSNPTSYFEGNSLSLPTPTRDNYTFLGWYTNPEFTGEPLDSITQDTKGDLALYAKWAQQFTITYNGRGGVIDDSFKTSYYEGESFNLQAPKRENDTFLGWYTNPEFTGEKIESIKEDTTGNIELYAKWTSDDNNNQNTKKCGKKNTVLVVNLLSTISLLAVVLRKKK